MSTNDEQVEKAARALFVFEQCDKRQAQDVEANWTGRLDDRDRDEYRELARAALDAAGVSALRAEVEWWKARAHAAWDVGDQQAMRLIEDRHQVADLRGMVESAQVSAEDYERRRIDVIRVLNDTSMSHRDRINAADDLLRLPLTPTDGGAS